MDSNDGELPPSVDPNEEEYAEFIKKVTRHLYVDNISPQVTESAMKAAFNQFGNVTGIQFVPTCTQPQGAPRAALVEMETKTQAKRIIQEMQSFPLMIAGMPRPVRAKTATPKMFDDRPRLPHNKIECRWLHPKEPRFKIANRITKLVKRHNEEALFLLDRQVMEEENLHKQQAKMLKVQHMKLELMESVFADGTAKHLGQHYGINAEDS